LVTTPVWLTRLFGMFVYTYGICVGDTPPPLIPLVPHESECQAVIVPSLFAAIFTLAKIDGRLPAISSSARRSRNIFTGRPPLAFDSRAATMPQRSEANLLPKPPPM